MTLEGKKKIGYLRNTLFQFLQNGEYESGEQEESIDDDDKNLMRERIAKKLKKDLSTNVKSTGGEEVERKSVSRR